MTNPYMERRARHKTKHGSKSEVRVVTKMGGTPTPGSGAVEGCKSDGVVDAALSLRIEAKATLNNSLSLKLAWLEKISKEAAETGRSPLLTVTFTHADGRPKQNGEWCLIPQGVLIELLELADKQGGT